MSMKILSIGEVLWDLLPSGRKVGGAPANFAFHCMQLGAEVQLLSRVGDDDLGRELIDFYRSLGLSTELIETDPTNPTGTVGVELKAGQPKYTIHENVAWDRIEATDAAIQYAKSADAVCFGSLAARTSATRQTIRTLVDVVSPSALRILDLNLRDPFTDRKTVETMLGLANVLKLNDDELRRVSPMFDAALFNFPENPSLQEQAEGLIRRYGLKMLILTCGAGGSWIFSEGKKFFHKSRKVDVVDTVGAGDAFTATVAVGLLSGWPLDTINDRANDFAAFVCTQNGATPKIPVSLKFS